MKKLRSFKLSENIYQMLRDIASDGGTSLTETIETLIVSEYAIRNTQQEVKEIIIKSIL